MNFGRYQIISEVGKGSMGVVYKAHDPQIDRVVALKVLRPDRITSEEFVQRFLKEARAIGRLSHPNIITVYDSGQDNDTLYIVMEFLIGKTLREAQQEKQLSLQEIIHIGSQVADALDYAHRQGIVHRDIKPSNILLTPEGYLKLTDFGIARIEDPTAHHQTQAGDILGTPIYMSPEQIMGRKVDGRSDLYSLGVILYELTTGRKPFQGENLAAIFNAIIEEKPPPIELPDTSLSQRLSALIFKSISKSTEDRFQTGAQLAQALKSCLQRRKSDAPPESVAPPKPDRMRFMLPLALGLALAAAVAGYFVVSRFMHGEQTPVATTTKDQAPEPIGIEKPKAETIPAKVALLEVTSHPNGAEVFMDGAMKGRTPLKVDLPLGTYEMKLTSPNHFEWEGQVQLDREGRIPLAVRLVPMEEPKRK